MPKYLNKMQHADSPANQTLLHVQNLQIGFKKGTQLHSVVHGVDFSIHPHETLALVGESGAGKSLSAQAILRLIPETTITYPEGEIVFEGQNLLALPQEELRHIRGNQISMIFQEPMSSLNPLHTVEKQLNETLFLHKGIAGRQATAISLNWLHRVGIRDPEQRLKAFPHQLSGGERQRVMIAMALINEPKLLIADEPTTALDVTIQAQILGLIKELQRELGMAMLFITHDLGIVRRVADRVAVMQAGKIVETNHTGPIFSHPQHPYTQQLLSAEPHGEPPEVNVKAEPMIQLRDLKVWFPIQKGVLRRTHGYVKAVDGLTFTIRKGHTLGVVGESGSGKTTLGKALLRLENSTGTIEFEQVALQQLNENHLRPLRREMQIIFQDPFGSLNPRMSIEQIIGEGLQIHHVGDTASQTQLIIDTLKEVGLDPARRHQFPHEFSGGERQRIAIARALVLKPKFIVLDEPTSSLDRSIQFQVIELLKQIQARHGLTYLFISHDLKLVTSLCHEIVIMQHGRVVEAGPTREILSRPQHIYTQELLRTAFENYSNFISREN